MTDDQLAGIKIWIVWYEDRFAFGSERDPASVVNFFLTEKEANDFIAGDIGPIDVASGKFDGLFTQEWVALEAINRGIISREKLLEKLLN